MRMLKFAGILVIMFASTMELRATAIAVHDWARNPVVGRGNKKWDLRDDSNGAHIFGVAPKDMGDKSAWKVDTKTGGAAGVGLYQKFRSREPRDWVLGATLRAVDIDAPGGQGVRLGGDPRIFGLLFSTSDDGDPIVSLEGSSFSREIQGGAGAYHTYTLFVRRTPQSELPLSRFSIDGELVFTGYEGFEGEFSDGLGPRIQWGDLDESADVNGRAHWGLVRWSSAVPEPSAIGLLLCGATGLAGFRPKRRE